MLSALTSSTSRSSTCSDNCKKVKGFYRSHSPEFINSATENSSAELAEVNAVEDVRYVYTAQPSSYWCGRFQSIHDTFRNETLQNAREDNLETQAIVPRQSFAERTKRDPPQHTEAEKGINMIFAELILYCVTEEAKRSLWDWQVSYAKKTRNWKLISQTSIRVAPGRKWASKIARTVSEGIGSGSRSRLKRCVTDTELHSKA
ncbi:hypothetical protein F5884DRAFT_858084 [Xylogone sp. PMI_703]|nr:hypothetical protein F5884DRAFT_858084 [Xylogone sp. PMI_703]